jgi:hypothetical protein
MNVVYIGVQVVLVCGAMLIAALLLYRLLERAATAFRAAAHVFATLRRCGWQVGTTVRPGALLLAATPSRAPPYPPRWRTDDDTGNGSRAV